MEDVTLLGNIEDTFISNKKIVETSKNSKGQVTSYRTEINLEFKIVNNNEIMKQ